MEIQREKKVAKNTIVLYLRLMVTMAISLYTSRLILNTLGVNDFGIYNVVAGFIAMFSILSDTLSTSVSRFITIAIGKDDIKTQTKVFSSSVNVLLTVALVVFILVEIFGLWFIKSKINVPIERMGVLNTVFQLAVINFSIGIFKVAFNSLIIAHEKATAFAWLAIGEAILKLVAILLLAKSPVDKLVTYVLFLLFINIFITFVAMIYCRLCFKECRYNFFFDSVLLKNMMKFTGWTLFGRGALIVSGHGVNMLLNVFFGVVVNAARGIASQVDGATRQFVYNVMMAINPQIIKSYSMGEITYMHRLIYKGAKYGCFIMLLYTIPIVCETEYILRIWLGIIPEYTTLFARLVFLESLFYVMTLTMNTAIQATGKIRNYQILTGMMLLLNIVITYVVFRMGASPAFAYVVSILVNVCIVMANLYYSKKLVGLSVWTFVHEVFYKTVMIFVFSICLPIVIQIMLPSSIWRLSLVVITSLIVTSCFIYSIGLNKNERLFILQAIGSRVRKFI